MKDGWYTPDPSFHRTPVAHYFADGKPLCYTKTFEGRSAVLPEDSDKRCDTCGRYLVRKKFPEKRHPWKAWPAVERVEKPVDAARDARSSAPRPGAKPQPNKRSRKVSP